MKKIILIPAYEPDDKLIELLKKIDTQEFDVVVVDDGSGDGYENIFKSCQKYSHVIQYDINCGKGHALKMGFQYIKEKYISQYVVITMDSDGQHTIKDARKLCDYVIQHSDTLVLGMRKRNLNVPLRSRIGNGITKFIYSIITGIDVYDTQTGLRAFSDYLMDFFLSIDGERFEYEMNVLLMCAKNKVPMKEIQIETIYIENNKGTHFHTFKDSYLVYKEIIKFSLSSIVSFLIDYLLFLFIFLASKQLIFSNICARVISASFNYCMNKKYVFHSEEGMLKSLFSYFMLAVIILICNTFLLEILVSIFSVYEGLAKVMVEVMMFLVSWLVQKYIVFKKSA